MATSRVAVERGIADEERILADEALTLFRDDGQLTHMLCDMLLQARFGAAYLMAKRQIAHGVWHPGIFLAQALGGLLYGDAATAAEGRTALHAATNALSAEQQASFYTLLLKPVIPEVLRHTFYGGDPARTLQLLDIVTAVSPSLRAVFDLSASVGPLDIDEMRMRGAERARLIPMHPTPPSPHRSRRVVVAMRNLVFPHIPASRPLDIGPHLSAGAGLYGWASTYYGMACRDAREDYRAIAALCEQEDADVLLLDEQMPASDSPYGRPARTEMLGRLRQRMPSLKIVGLYLDAWQVEPTTLRAAAAEVDVVWSPSPAQPVWQEAAFTPKCLFTPLTYDIPDSRPVRKLESRMFFGGGVMGYNWHRAFWLTAAASAKLPIEARLSNHASDGLSALDSSAVYMRDLADATCVVNFSMRPDLSRIVTGRSFETCLAGSLLIQEATADMDYYFVAGEHYLEFSTFAELCAIARFLSEQPDEAEDVRHRGAAFARERYNDQSIIGDLDRHLATLGVVQSRDRVLGNPPQ